MKNEKEGIKGRDDGKSRMGNQVFVA